MAIVYLVRHGQAGFGAAGADSGSGLFDDLGGADVMVRAGHGLDCGPGRLERAYDGLSPLGVEQAELTGRALAARIFGAGGAGASAGSVGGASSVALYSGPLQRQLATAGAIAPYLGAELAAKVECVDDLREYDADEVVGGWLARQGADLAAGPGAADGVHGVAGGVGGVVMRAIAEWETEPGFARFQEQVQRGLQQVAAGAAKCGCAVAVTSGGVIAAAAQNSLGGQWSKWARHILTSSISVFRVEEAPNPDGERYRLELLSFNEHGHLDEPDADGVRRLRKYR